MSIAHLLTRITTSLVALCVALDAPPVSACPQIFGFNDFNCDQRLRIAITGDSIAYGRGDDNIGEDGGGYVTRISSRLPMFEFMNLGIPGITSRELLREFKQNLPKVPPGETRLKSTNIDCYIIDVGRNDYFIKNAAERTPAKTVANIRRLVNYIRSTLATMDGVAPMIIITRLTPTNRSYQRSFIQKINQLLLSQQSAAFPTYLDYSALDASLLSPVDGLHPTPEGYSALTKILRDYITAPLQKRMAKARPDNDMDGVYDLFEKTKFGTDPAKADTDGDGISDGLEIFTYGTNPLTP